MTHEDDANREFMRVLEKTRETHLVSNIEYRGLPACRLRLLQGALWQHGPQLVEVNDGAVFPVPQQVEVAHTHLVRQIYEKDGRRTCLLSMLH